MGISTRDEKDKLIISSVNENSPADDAGLESGDEIDSLDGSKLTSATLMDKLSGMHEGDTVNVLIMRDGRAKEIKVILRNIPSVEYTISKVEAPTELQRSIYESWLSSKW
jgi:predicted metalloprotease with PDZ domain